MAAGGPHRCLAQPSNAPKPRSRSAGTADRSFRSRLRPNARRPGSDSDAGRKNCRRADIAFAFHPAACRCRRRAALASSHRARQCLSCLGTRARPARKCRARAPAVAETAARSAASEPFGHRDRTLAARSLYDLREARTAPGAARCGRHAPWRRRARHGHSRRAWRIHPALCKRPAGRSGGRTHRRSGGRTSPRWNSFRKRARSGGRGFSVSRAGSAPGRPARRANISSIVAEIRGEIEIALDDGSFKLRGIADCIESHADGRYAVLDYKTGSARTERQVRTGLAPQLTLEAAMLRQGGFKDIPSRQLGRCARLRDAQRRRARRRIPADRLQGRHA